jgi:hypothetical protein
MTACEQWGHVIDDVIAEGTDLQRPRGSTSDPEASNQAPPRMTLDLQGVVELDEVGTLAHRDPAAVRDSEHASGLRLAAATAAGRRSRRPPRCARRHPA